LTLSIDVKEICSQILAVMVGEHANEGRIRQ